MTAHSAGSVHLQVVCGGRVVSETCQFDYRPHQPQPDTHHTDCITISGAALNQA